MDPEVPVLSVMELGIVRGVEVVGGTVTVTITPTYSGCPAMHVIEAEIRAALLDAGFDDVRIETVFAPAWTTDWIAAPAREKLRAYGIAPPGPVAREESGAPIALGRTVRTVPAAPSVPAVPCPYCGSPDTVVESEFGSTACKSLLSCRTCHQPFEHFKAF